MLKQVLVERWYTAGFLFLLGINN